MEFLKKIAPTLVSCLAGPAAGLAVEAVGSLLGVSDATTESVTTALQTATLNESQIIELKKIEADLKAKEQELGFKFAELEFKNTQGARDMQMATKSNFPAFLSAFITFGFFLILSWMLYDDTIKNSEPVLIMLGSLGASFGAVVNFWLGSTNGSQTKTHLLAAK